MPTSALPPDFAILSRLADAEEPNVRELLQYALATLLVEDGKAEIIERHTIDLRELLTPRIVAGDTFTIVEPYVSEELLAQMRELAREILGEDGDSAK